MTYAKTPSGLAALRLRTGMTPRQRAAFILFDGKRSCTEVRASSQVADEEIAQMAGLGWIAPVATGSRQP